MFALRRGWLIAGASCAALALFLAFLIASFPYNDTASALLAPYRLKLIYQAQHLRLPFGVRLEDASLISTDGGISHPPLAHSSEIILTPALGSLLFGTPGLNLHAQLYAGTIAATIHQNADAIDLVFNLDALDLAQCAPLQQFEATLGGSLSGAGSAVIR
ncbi:MAG: hypothetical protein ACREQD_14270, partial [Candidatus Binataceae bacterium]